MGGGGAHASLSPMGETGRPQRHWVDRDGSALEGSGLELAPPRRARASQDLGRGRSLGPWGPGVTQPHPHVAEITGSEGPGALARSLPNCDLQRVTSPFLGFCLREDTPSSQTAKKVA